MVPPPTGGLVILLHPYMALLDFALYAIHNYTGGRLHNHSRTSLKIYEKFPSTYLSTLIF